VLTRDWILRCIVLHSVGVHIAWTVAETTLRAKLAYALLEKATSHSARRTGIAAGRGRHRVIDAYVVSSRLHMSIPTVISLATCAILEVSKTKVLITIVQGER